MYCSHEHGTSIKRPSFASEQIPENNELVTLSNKCLEPPSLLRQLASLDCGSIVPSIWLQFQRMDDLGLLQPSRAEI